MALHRNAAIKKVKTVNRPINRSSLTFAFRTKDSFVISGVTEKERVRCYQGRDATNFMVKSGKPDHFSLQAM
jgi:hypothetical protein